MIHWDMLKKPFPEQTALEMVTLDSLVPKDHLLRKIDAVIDFSFIHDRVADLYCADNDRPALEAERALHGQRPIKEKERQRDCQEFRVRACD